MSIPFTIPIVTQHTAFSAEYYCKKGANLFSAPFDQFQQQITHPENYQFTQNLGSQLREQGFGGLIYPSARCPDSGTNIALFTPDSIISSKPNEQNQWVCELNKEQVTFSSQHPQPSIKQFCRTHFEINGYFPSFD